MSLVRRTPRGLSALDPFSGFDSLFENFMTPVRLRELENELHMPSTDIRETKDAYEVTAELPAPELVARVAAASAGALAGVAVDGRDE